MSRFKGPVASLIAVITAGTLLAAAPIKLGTPAPTGSMWQKRLLEMGNAWSKATEGRVTLNVFADGSQGDEATTIRKMRPGIEQLQAGLFTVGGLSTIDDAFNVFGMPFFFENDEEELAVQKKLEPRLEQILQAKGYHLVSWGTGGWVQIFSKQPLKTLADVKRAKLYASKDDPRMVQWYTQNGFNPQPLMLGDIGTQLKLPTGMIDTTPDTPYLALTMQIFTNAKYMLDVHIAPLVGALIVSSSAWNKISAEDRGKMTEAARTMENEIRAEAPKQDADSIAAMKPRGLTVVTPDARAVTEFHTAADGLLRSMRGAMVPADVYDMAVAERDSVRKTAKH